MKKQKKILQLLFLLISIIFVNLSRSEAFGTKPSPESCFVFFEWGNTIVGYGASYDRSILDYCPQDVVIPETINGKPVKFIWKQAFERKWLTSVVIPDSVITIWERAFNQNNLTKIKIWKAVESIEDRAFNWGEFISYSTYPRENPGNQITSLIIPNSVKNIWKSAFAYNKITSIEIPNSVTSLWERAFSDNELERLKLPNSLTTIEKRAFSSNNLVELNIPHTVSKIGEWAFAYNRLNSLNLPKMLKNIERMAFSSNRLTTITIPQWLPKIEEWVFAHNQLTSIVIPNSVRNIWDFAFAYNNLTSLTVPDSVRNIGEYAFLKNELDIINIPKSVNFIWAAAFNNNKLSKDQALIFARNPDGSEDKTTIVSYWGTQSHLNIPSSVVNIGKYTFEPNLVDTIFYNPLDEDEDFPLEKWSLVSVVIPASVVSIWDFAFTSNQLTSIVIPNSVRNIWDFAFANNQLTSIVIPKSVKNIWDFAFASNYLTTAKISDSVKKISEGLFYNNQLNEIELPESVVDIQESAFEKNFLTNIIIPESVKNIEIDAFEDNLGLSKYGGKVLGISSNNLSKINNEDEWNIKLVKWIKVSFQTLWWTNVSTQVLDLNDNKLVKEPEKPTREGYRFKGWYIDLPSTKKFDFNSKVSKDTTLYAKWQKKFFLFDEWFWYKQTQKMKEFFR